MINQDIRTLVKEYVEDLKKNHIPVEKAIVFGSQAKGTAHKWSDIDTCIVSPIFGQDRHSERLQLMKVLSLHNFQIEPHPYSPHDFENTYDPLITEIKRHGVEIV